MFDFQNELAEISRKFLGKYGIYEYDHMKISKMNNERVIKVCHNFCQENGLMDEFIKYKSSDKLLLSADGPISLYSVKKEVLENFDKLLHDFYKTKTTNFYDETLFVEYLKEKLGNESIEFVKVIEFPINDEYKNIKHYNF